MSVRRRGKYIWMVRCWLLVAGGEDSTIWNEMGLGRHTHTRLVVGNRVVGRRRRRRGGRFGGVLLML